MNDQNTQRVRFYELLADEQLGQLSPEDLGELTELRLTLDIDEPETVGEMLVMMDQMSLEMEEIGELPDSLAQAIAASGKAIVGANAEKRVAGRIDGTASTNDKRSIAWPLGLAAAIVIAGGSVGMMLRSQGIHAQQTSVLQGQVAMAETQQLELSGMLSDAMDQLDLANQTIAFYETPTDPTELLAKRRELLSVPETVMIAWSPFDQPGSLAEQQGVVGDVVWNDELEEGYLRFVGLEVNDPDIEQYQVWVIDDRGLEQRVSGGVFNASADGEVVVPIEPGIDMGRVALFAITIEAPGGTWVSDLQRRVVVAPRAEG